MRRGLAILLLLCAAARGAGPFEKGAVSDNRFLLILNTSYGMRLSREKAEECLVGLIQSGIQGKMRAGDTFGIWTFNNKLHVGEFPMQIWTPALNTTLARQVKDFLDKQSYDNRTHFEVVAKPLAEVVQSSRSLIVFLVTDGADPVKGTPFDVALNKAIKSNRKALKGRHMPFVIIMGIEDGAYKAVTLNSTINLKIPDVARVPLPPPVSPTTAATNTIATTTGSVPTNHPVATPLYAAPIDPSPAPDPSPVEQPHAAATEKTPTTAQPATDRLKSPAPDVSNTGIATNVLNSGPSPAPSASTARPPEAPRVTTSMVATDQPAVTNAAPSAAVNPAKAESLPAGQNQSMGETPNAPAVLGQSARPPVPAKSEHNPGMLLWAAVAFVFASVALAWTLLRGSKARPSTSLISRSIEKNKRDGG